MERFVLKQEALCFLSSLPRAIHLSSVSLALWNYFYFYLLYRLLVHRVALNLRKDKAV